MMTVFLGQDGDRGGVDFASMYLNIYFMCRSKKTMQKCSWCRYHFYLILTLFFQLFIQIPNRSHFTWRTESEKMSKSRVCFFASSLPSVLGTRLQNQLKRRLFLNKNNNKVEQVNTPQQPPLQPPPTTALLLSGSIREMNHYNTTNNADRWRPLRRENARGEEISQDNTLQHRITQLSHSFYNRSCTIQAYATFKP